MTTWTISRSSGASTALGAPEVQPGDILFSTSTSYSVQELIGEGCFGVVTRCLNLDTSKTVAVKILKKTDGDCDPEKEVSMLETIRDFNLDRYNMVKFFERFEHQGHTCLALEMLHGNLEDRVQERGWRPLSLQEIRPIAMQLLVALDVLADAGILHTDIKPDNVMFVSSWDRPSRIKLIDFGVAIPITEVCRGMEMQPIGYRAPEITLGLPITHSVDVWGAGCTLAFLYLADDLFPVDCKYQMMNCMVKLLGQPEDHLLRAGVYTNRFFRKVEEAHGPTWRLMTPEEYEAVTRVKPEERISFNDMPGSLDDLVHMYPEKDPSELQDRRAFAAFLKQLLQLDWCQRISPHRALQQPFITMAHLTSPDSSAYLAASEMMMKEVEESENEGTPPTSPPLPPTEAAEAGLSEREPSPVVGGLLARCSVWSSETSSLPCGPPSLSRDLHLDARSGDEEIWSQSSDEDPDLCSSLGTEDVHEEIPSQSSDEDPDLCSSLGTEDVHEEIPSQSSDEDPDLCSSLGTEDMHGDAPAAESSVDQAEIKDCTAAASAPSGRARKLLTRMRRFLRRITASLCCCGRPTVED